MEIIIWGTGVRGRRAKAVCDKTGRKIKAFTDNDFSRWGGSLDGIPIISPNDIPADFTANTQIWIATGAIEVYEQAKKISNNILEWQVLRQMLLSDEYPYSSPKLKDRNICHCRLVENRNGFLKCFAGDAPKWKMAEIGVFQGDFSERILEICNPKKLYLIDMWGKGHEGNYSLVKEKFSSELESGKVELMRGLSLERLNDFKDGELDWAYIDTAHDYDTTKAELELCHQKVRPGGYICGHDYAKHNIILRIDYGVYDAVNEFAVNYDYEFVYLTAEWHGLQSFCLRKI